MTESELARLRSWVGDSPADSELEELVEQLGTLRAAAEAVIRGRLNALLSSPVNWQADGDYSQDDSNRIKALQAQLADLRRQRPDLSGEIPPTVTTGGAGRVVQLVREGNRR